MDSIVGKIYARGSQESIINHPEFEIMLKRLESKGIDTSKDCYFTYFVVKRELVHSLTIHLEISDKGKRSYNISYTLAGYAEYFMRKDQGKRASLMGDRRDKHLRESFIEGNGWMEDEAHYYCNQVLVCPFSGYVHDTKDVEGVHQYAHTSWWNTSPKYLLSKLLPGDAMPCETPYLYRRSNFTKGMTRKEFLESDRYALDGPVDMDAKHELLEGIYPKPKVFVKSTIEDIVERRARKRIRRNKVTKKEKDMFRMILGASKLKKLINK